MSAIVFLLPWYLIRDSLEDHIVEIEVKLGAYSAQMLKGQTKHLRSLD